MPRPKPDHSNEAQTLSFSVPRWMAVEFWQEAGEGYGSRTHLFRQLWTSWKDTRDLRRQLDEERARRIRVEQALIRVGVAVKDVT